MEDVVISLICISMWLCFPIKEKKTNVILIISYFLCRLTWMRKITKEKRTNFCPRFMLGMSFIFHKLVSWLYIANVFMFLCVSILLMCVCLLLSWRLSFCLCASICDFHDMCLNYILSWLSIMWATYHKSLLRWVWS